MNLALLPRTEFSGLDTTLRTSSPIPTKATTGTTEIIVQAPCTGTLIRATMVFKEGLTASDSNYLTMLLTNKGQAASGSAAMLAVGGLTTTQATGGGTIVAYLQYVLPVSLTAANLRVVDGDVLAFNMTVTAGTLANTLSQGFLRLSFTPD